MKARKIKKVSFTSPKLRLIRKNFRQIFKLAYFDELERLMKMQRLYRKKYIRQDSHLVPSQYSRWMSLSKRHDKLYHDYHDSILVCSSGATCTSYREMKEKGMIKPSERPIDLDMVWVPHKKAWFCTKCYERKYKIKICENCWETNETMVKISECFICNRYICESCENLCLDCKESYCDQCYYEHMSYGKCQVCGEIATKE